MYMLVLTTIILRTEFEMSSFLRSKEMIRASTVNNLMAYLCAKLENFIFRLSRDIKKDPKRII